MYACDVYDSSIYLVRSVQGVPTSVISPYYTLLGNHMPRTRCPSRRERDCVIACMCVPFFVIEIHMSVIENCLGPIVMGTAALNTQQWQLAAKVALPDTVKAIL